MTWMLRQDEAEWGRLSRVCAEDLRVLASHRAGYEHLSPRLQAIRARIQTITERVSSGRDEGPRVVDPIDPPRHGHARHKHLAEVVGERATRRWLLESYERLDLSSATLCEVHRRLYAGQRDGAGRYKTKPVYIVNTPLCGQPASASMIRTTPPEDIDAVMQDIHNHLARLLEGGEVDPMLVASAYFADLLRAHPFSDGNGRTARTTLMLMLLKYGHAATPYLDLPFLFDARRTAYLAAAQRASRPGPEPPADALPLIRFLVRLLNEAYTRLSGRVDRLEAALASNEMPGA